MRFQLSARWDDTSRTFDLRVGENVVGSETDCDVVLRHPGVSRHHAVLLVLGDRVEVADLGSQNGTFIGGRRLTRKTTLESDAPLAFGTVEARLAWLRDDDAQPAAIPAFEALGCADATTTAERPSRDVPMQATTASVGPLQLFSLVHLPRLVEVLGQLDPGAAAAAARAAGEALSGALPCSRVTVVRGRGVLFQNDPSHLVVPPHEATDTAESAETPQGALQIVCCGAADLELEVEFESATAARLYRPIVAATVQLLAMATRRPAARRPAIRPTRQIPEPSTEPPFPEPATLDPELRDLYEKARRVAASDQNVLILGASGTGKELLARFVHQASARRDRPWVALNCAALPQDLLEAELFGIDRGVATGVEARPGRFEQAHGGTLFLDEIGDMAPRVQAKILRVLQEKSVHRLGGLDPRPADVRVVSATHQDVDALRAAGRFRDDLYHRIADWRFRLPSLVQRAVDIPNLAAYFLARETRRRGIEVAGISRAALRVLCRHPWPGNVRQLEKEIAKAVLFVAQGGLLDTRCLDDELLLASPPRTTLREYLEQMEAREIRRALAASRGDVPRTAEDLGLPESTLYRKIRHFRIRTSGDGAESADQEA